MRLDKAGQGSLDFSAFLSQAMQSKDWAGTQTRQALAELTPAALERPAPEQTQSAESPAGTPGSSRNSTLARNDIASNTTGTHQELTQRALRSASLRAAQSRADGTASNRPSQTDTRARKTGPRRDDEAHTNPAMGNPMALPPTSAHRPVQDTSDVPASAGDTTAAPLGQENAATNETASSASWLDAHLSGASTEAQIGTAAQTAGAGGLTTVQLSPHLNIITPGQGVVSEQSLQSFAQSMGIDAGQFKQLMTAVPAGSMDASGLRAGVTASDALNGTPLLNVAPTDLTAIDLSQVVPVGMALEDLQIEWMGGRRGNGLDVASLSTLEVLGMRDAGLGPDAVSSLQESADAGAQGQQPDNTNGGMASSQIGANARTGATTANAAAAPQNMAEHFEKLSAKLATEMAGRIHEQFSQGEWKMKFALKPASLGQVDVQLEMRDGKLAAVLQADNPMTQDLLQNGSQRLRDALSQMGLSQSSVSVGDGRSQAFQGDRQPGAHGSASAGAQRPDSSDDAVQTVSHAPRRDSLSQLDFYA